MTAPTRTEDRRTAAAAIAAGVLLFASVAAETVRPAQEPDGSVTDIAGFALYLTGWTLGAAALLVALLGLGDRTHSRAGRIGRAVALAGATLLLAFGAVGLVSALVDGAPAEWSFLLFAVGLLMLVAGSVPLALGLRRTGDLGGWWVAVLVAGAGGLVALGAEADPWHDLGLFLFDAAWVAVGLRLLSAEPVRADIAPVG